MKFWLTIILVLLIGLFSTACTTTNTKDPSSETPPEISQPTSEVPPPESELTELPPPVIADAAMYRGTVAAQQEQFYTLEQFPGTNFGIPELVVEIPSELLASLPENEQPAIGDYLEVYYGGELEPNVPVLAIAVQNLGSAQTRNLNGIVTTVSLPPEGDTKGSFTLQNDQGQEFIVHFNNNGETQIYMNVADIQPEIKLNILVNPMLAASEPPQTFALEIRPYSE